MSTHLLKFTQTNKKIQNKSSQLKETAEGTYSNISYRKSYTYSIQNKWFFFSLYTQKKSVRPNG